MSYDYSIGCRLIKPGFYIQDYPEYEEDIDMQFEAPINIAAIGAPLAYAGIGQTILNEIVRRVKRKVAKGFMYFDAYHYCLLLENNIIEYSNSGLNKRLNVGKIDEFIWNFDGKTNTSFKDLEKIIEKDNENWTDKKYKPKEHNCQHFVNYCLEKIGVNEKVITKYTYKEQRKKHNKEKKIKEEEEEKIVCKKKKNDDCLII